MKQSKAMLLINILFIVIVVTTIVGYIVSKIKYQNVEKEILVQTEKYSAKENTKVKLVAEVQKLETEERVVTIVSENLGLKKIINKYQVVINKDEIENMLKKIDKKYE